MSRDEHATLCEAAKCLVPNEMPVSRLLRALETPLGASIAKKSVEPLLQALDSAGESCVDRQWLLTAVTTECLRFTRVSSPLHCDACGVASRRGSPGFLVRLDDEALLCLGCYGKLMALRNLGQHILGADSASVLHSLYKGCRLCLRSETP